MKIRLKTTFWETLSPAKVIHLQTILFAAVTLWTAFQLFTGDPREAYLWGFFLVIYIVLQATYNRWSRQQQETATREDEDHGRNE